MAKMNMGSIVDRLAAMLGGGAPVLRRASRKPVGLKNRHYPEKMALYDGARGPIVFWQKGPDGRRTLTSRQWKRECRRGCAMK